MVKYILLLIPVSGALCTPAFWIGDVHAPNPPPIVTPPVFQDHEASTVVHPEIPSTIPEESESTQNRHEPPVHPNPTLDRLDGTSTFPGKSETVQNKPGSPVHRYPILDQLAGIGGSLIGIPGSVVRFCAESCNCNPFRTDCALGQRVTGRERRDVHATYYPAGGLGYYGRPHYHGYQHSPYYLGNYYHGYYYYPRPWGYIRDSDEADEGTTFDKSV